MILSETGETNTMNADNLIKLPPQDNCFACGDRNEYGLKMDLYYNREKETVSCKKTIEEYYNGFYGITHGGIISTMLDESMAWAAIIYSEHAAVTISMKTEFKLPVRTGNAYTVHADIVEGNDEYVKTHALIRDERGKEYAEAEAVFKVMKGRSKRFGDYSEFARRVKNGI